MPLNIVELRQQKARLIQERRKIMEHADDLGRVMSAEELAKCNQLQADSNALDVRISAEEQQNAIEADLARTNGVNVVEMIYPSHSVGYQNGENRSKQYPQPVDYASNVLSKDQSYRSYLEQRGLINAREYEGISLDDYMAGVLVGPRGPRAAKVKRALDETEGSTGSYVVPSILAAIWWDTLRPGTPTFDAGAKLLPLDTQSTSVATLEQDVTFSVVAENQLITDADPVFGRRVLSPFKVCALVKFSFEIDEDSPNLGAMLNRSFTAAARVKLESLALNGLGTGATPDEPLGVLNYNTISEVLNVGLPGDYDDVLNGCLALWEANTEPNMALMSPTSFRTFAGLKTSTENAPLPKPPAIANLPFRQTTAMPDTSILVGDFRDLVYGIRSEIRLQRLTERFAEYGQRALLGWFRFDVALIHPASFCKLTGVTES